jgi:hypothetical protein
LVKILTKRSSSGTHEPAKGLAIDSSAG